MIAIAGDFTRINAFNDDGENALFVDFPHLFNVAVKPGGMPVHPGFDLCPVRFFQPGAATELPEQVQHIGKVVFAGIAISCFYWHNINDQMAGW